MSMVVDWLKLLNRKERYYLVKQAIGRFSLSDYFRRTLSAAIDHEIPENTRMWMDYPFDWVYAAIQLADVYPLHDAVSERSFSSPDFRFPGANQPVYVNANQEDVDLLVAFKDPPSEHLVMIEAKGVTSFANRQFRSKLNRMRVIFDPAASWYRPDVVPQLVLASPSPPRFLNTEPWFPDWVLQGGKPRWVRLDLENDLRRIERWDETTAKPSKAAATWHIRDATAATLA